ncbi:MULTISPECIES: hypothetical protein [unclassified Arcicella]|uniref:hypothetical protein n=1 Tax=unclassified Arcicella TaxID=2644986 RepID=UPI0028632A03|nr:MULTISPECIES: hypothetical protein [unclassified Arcicella]MDR6564936.1 hypothetical protein [Arcicella sp. BE51]MDR6814726.1 hypothetical protein [Arcicella sp. BE140]MDR6826172.1 hypothetical protein [Arcicella sp. BE139]
MRIYFRFELQEIQSNPDVQDFLDNVNSIMPEGVQDFGSFVSFNFPVSKKNTIKFVKIIQFVIKIMSKRRKQDEQ